MEHINGYESNGKPDIKILVVDDREDNLFAIETILEKDGYTIIKVGQKFAVRVCFACRINNIAIYSILVR